MTVADEPHRRVHPSVRELLDLQLARNRWLSAVLIAAAVLNSALVAAVATLASQSLAAGAVTACVVEAVVVGVSVLLRLLPHGLYLDPADPLTQRVTARVEPIVQRLSSALGIEPPQVHVVGDEAWVAFSYGYGHSGQVAFSPALVDGMDDPELAAVAAHELAHIANRDTRLVALSEAMHAFIFHLASLNHRIAGIVYRIGLAWSGFRSRDEQLNLVVRLIGLHLMFTALFMVAAGQLWAGIAQLLRRALGRQREWMADATAVRLTGDAAALISALHRLEYEETATSRGGRAVQDICFVGPATTNWWSELLDTHPSIPRRIARLQAIADGRHRPGGPAGPIAALAAIVALVVAIGVGAAQWHPTKTSPPAVASEEYPAAPGLPYPGGDTSPLAVASGGANPGETGAPSVPPTAGQATPDSTASGPPGGPNPATTPSADSVPPATPARAAPMPPTGVDVVALSPRTIRVRWTDTSADETGFDISDGITVVRVGAGTHQYDWGNLAPKTYKCFKVRSVNDSGMSPYAPTTHPFYVCATTPADPQPPTITDTSTYQEGQLIYLRITYTDPDGDAAGFGFRGANGSGWAEEQHPFTAPSYGRVGPGYVDYPFNHGCGTNREIHTSVTAWIYDSRSVRSTPATVSLTCS